MTWFKVKAQGEEKRKPAQIQDDRPIASSANIRLDENDQALMIMKAEKDDAGRYRCVAENEAGKDEHDLALDVLGEEERNKTLKNSLFKSPRRFPSAALKVPFVHSARA